MFTKLTRSPEFVLAMSFLCVLAAYISAASIA